MSRIACVVGANAGVFIGGVADAFSFGAKVRPSHRLVIEPHPGVALCAVGHRNAPLCKRGGVSVAIDGRIYNRRDLNADGDDSCVFAELYRRHGFQGALERINGDFAVALYDESDDSLWFARDRMGIKPLYYTSSRGSFVVASRPRALLSLPESEQGINARFAAVFAGSHYRYIDNRPEESPYIGISQALAAHWYRLKKGAITSGRYWSLEDAPDFDAPEAELAEQYRDLLLDAVDIRTRCATRPAFTLSGGMDSSSVLAGAGERMGGVQVAYSTVYADKTFDESHEIQSMLHDGRVKWNQVNIENPDIFDVVKDMVAAHDEPVATATWLSHFVLCDHVAQSGYDTLFGGLGGDELNAGEYEYFFFHFADLKRAGRNDELNHEIASWARHHDHPIWHKNSSVAEATMARCTDAQVPGRCIPDGARMRRYYDLVDRAFFDLNTFSPVMETPFESYLKTRTYQDLTRETAPCCLRAEDRQSEAYGIENALPFFDYRLAEFMFRVPGTMKIRDGITKRLLREAMRGILPEETRARIKKTGWNAPAHLWFSGVALDNLADMIHSRAFRERGIYNTAAVENLISEHRNIVLSGEPRDNHMMFLWQLLNLEMWLQQSAPANIRA